MDERYCFDAAAGTHPGWRYPENKDAVLLGRQVWQRPLIRTCGNRPRLLAGVADGVAFAACAGRASSRPGCESCRLAIRASTVCGRASSSS